MSRGQVYGGALIGLGVSFLGVMSGAQERESYSVDGWRQATPGYGWQFPRDHGSHPDYRIEWWYYTGNLQAAGGRRFGYQVTFFRVGVDPAPENPSRWAVRDLYMAHLAVTDVQRGRHLVAERLNRAGVGWAGASAGELMVWNGDWRVDQERGIHRVSAIDRRFGIELELEPGKGPIRHGKDGLSQKGAEPGNASYYYSMPRMPTRGRLRLDDEWIDVSGLSWMDHEFGTTFLEPNQVGWDWFSLQLEDGSDLMVFQLRRGNGETGEYSSGTWIDPAGDQTAVAADGLSLVAGRTWLSPLSGARYPVEWSLDLRAVDARLEVIAALDAQELHTDASTGVTYWEGAVTVRGRVGERRLRGRGYLEMTGYSGQPMSEVFR